MANSEFIRNLIQHLELQRSNTDADHFVASLGAPSVSVAILDHGKIDTHCFSTVGDTSDTIFQACSISKAVTATGVMRLVDQGHLRTSDKIADLLPDEIVDSLGAPALVRSITFAQVLSHTAGLSVWGFRGYGPDDLVPSARDVILGESPVNSLPVKLVGLPGRKWSYSGGGYTLLQIALEKLTNRPFAELMDDLVLRPLGMNHSTYKTISSPDRSDTPYIKPAKAYWTSVTTAPHWHRFPELAAAGLWTTPRDLLKLSHAIQQSLTGDQDRFLKAETARTMLTVVDNGYGLGWKMPTEGPVNIFGHNGANDPGYRCMTLAFADLPGSNGETIQGLEHPECGIAVMTNASTGVAAFHTIAQTVCYLKGWGECSPPGRYIPYITPTAALKEIESSEWKKWEGTWSKDWVLQAHDEKPKLRYKDLEPVEIRPAAIYPGKYDQGTSIDFVLEGLGDMLRLGWKDGERFIEYWDGLTAKSTDLFRDSS